MLVLGHTLRFLSDRDKLFQEGTYVGHITQAKNRKSWH